MSSRLISFLAASACASGLAQGAIGAGGAAHAGPPEAIEQLLENVHYWEAHNRPDKAAEAWRKVLRSDPTHADALAALALMDARQGRSESARELLARLRAAHPTHAHIAGLERALGLGTRYDQLLAEARTAVKEGRSADGVALYKKLFDGEAPSGDVALEYYQTLGGSPGGWEEARVGLERLAGAHPNDSRYGLVAARHLTYNDATRREAIRRLEVLATGPNGPLARAAWRQALLWLAGQAGDVGTYERFLAGAPNDQDVKKRLADIRSGVAAKNASDADRDRLKAGFEALDTSKWADAEALFRRAVQANQRDQNALAGLGNTLLKQEKFEDAKATFEKLKLLAPTRPELWTRSLATAEFWALVKRAAALRTDKQLDLAETTLGEALALAEKSEVAGASEAELLLANVFLDAGRDDDARARLEALAAAEKPLTGALQALLELYLREGDEGKAVATNQALAAIEPTLARKEGSLRGELLRRQAQRKRESGDLQGAAQVLAAAVSADPDAQPILVDQAYAALALGDKPTARAAVDRIAQLRAGKAEVRTKGTATAATATMDRSARLVTAWVLAAELRFNEGLDQLAPIPDAELDAAGRHLRRRLKVQTSIAAAVKMAARGKLISAQAQLTELQHQTIQEPELTGLVANAWADIGKYEQGLNLMDEALASAKKEAPTLKLQLAAILHKAARESELMAVLRELEGESDLTVAERQGLAELQIAHAVRRADIAREKGELARALEMLQRPLEDYPDDPRLMTALGRLFVTAGEYSDAATLFGKVLAQTPNDLEARQGAIQAAIGRGHKDDARKLAADGLAAMNDSPRMHLVAGRMHVMLGEDGQAVDQLERAIALEEVEGTPETARDGRLAQLLIGAAERFGSRSGEREDLTLHAEIAHELDAIRARHAVRVGTEVAARYRPGVSGLGAVTALVFPTWLSIPTGTAGHLTFTASPILLDAGTLDLADPNSGEIFGTTGVDRFGTADGKAAQSLPAIELKLEQTLGAWRFTVGSTPLGFSNQTVVGGIRWNERFGVFGIGIEGWRKAVDDSLLSWAGATDPTTGAVWGGVLRHGGRLELGLTLDDATLYAYGGGDWWQGTRTAENTSVEAGAGVLWHLYDWEDTHFSTGLTALTLFFEKNLRHFTFGQGGYFSPDLFLNAGVPIRWRGKAGGLTFDLQATLGVNWFRESDTPYYPTDPARQAARADTVDAEGASVRSVHLGQESVAFAFDAKGEAAYQFASGFQIGLRAQVHTGHDFQETLGALFLGYTFQRKVEAQGSHESLFGAR